MRKLYFFIAAFVSFSIAQAQIVIEARKVVAGPDKGFLYDVSFQDRIGFNDNGLVPAFRTIQNLERNLSQKIVSSNRDFYSLELKDLNSVEIEQSAQGVGKIQFAGRYGYSLNRLTDLMRRSNLPTVSVRRIGRTTLEKVAYQNEYISCGYSLVTFYRSKPIMSDWSCEIKFRITQNNSLASNALSAVAAIGDDGQSKLVVASISTGIKRLDPNGYVFFFLGLREMFQLDLALGTLSKLMLLKSGQNQISYQTNEQPAKTRVRELKFLSQKISASVAVIDRDLVRASRLTPGDSETFCSSVSNGVCLMSQDQAQSYCSVVGKHLPTAREWAVYAASRMVAGAAGGFSEINQRTGSNDFLISTTNPGETQTDSFYYDLRGYQQQPVDLLNYRVWSSSGIPFSKAYGFAFDGIYGGMTYYGLNQINAVRCASGQ